MEAIPDLRPFAYAAHLAITALVLAGLRRRRDRPRIEIALLYLVGAIVVASEWATRVGLPVPKTVRWGAIALFFLQPSILLQLTHRLRPIPRAVRAVSLAAGLVSGVLLVLYTDNLPDLTNYVLVATFLGPEAYAAFALIQGARQSRGVTRRRTTAAATGTLLLALDFFCAAIAEIEPQTQGIAHPLAALFGLGSAYFWLVGFAPPASLRRAWHLGALHRYLRETSASSPDARARRTVELLPTAALHATGAFAATLATRRPDGAVTFPADAPRGLAEAALPWPGIPTGGTVVRARPAPDPATAAAFARAGAAAAFVAPLPSRDGSVTLLVALLPQEPVFADDDLSLLALLAEHAARAREEARLVDDLRAALERAERLSNIGLHVARVSHEANNLISYTRTSLEMARDLGATPEDLDQALQGMDRVLTLTSSLKLAVREERSSRDRVDANEIARSTHQLMRFAIPRHVKLQVETAPEPVHVLANAAGLQECLLNLAKNAVEALGESPGTVAIRVATEGDRAVLSVRDDGPGIPPDVRDRLFQGFFTTKAGGTGLGLGIVQKTVQDHDGTLDLETEVGKGTAFLIRLPRMGKGPEKAASASLMSRVPP